jgi:hypothetical protein
LGLRLRHKPVYYRLVPDVREIVLEEDPSRRVSYRDNLAGVQNLNVLATFAARLLTLRDLG